jgi:putative endonuclease
VVARNWRAPSGEIDLVVARGSLLVFCEVKTRSGLTFGEPFEAVTRAKQARLRRLAAEFLRARPRAASRPAEVRFDVASVLTQGVDVIEGAF